MNHIRIDDMQLGPRLREDLGDIEELARSIARHGLLHPPVLSRDKRLIAGMRRVRACQLLGWTEIEVRWIDELPEDERLAIELEENLRRKDLTAYEHSRGLMQQAEAMANRLSREAQVAAENPLAAHENPLPGRPPKPDADAKVAAEIGVSQSALSLAKQHVAVVEKYPELRKMTQRRALDTAKELDGLPEDAREQRRETLGEPAPQPQADEGQSPRTTPATAHMRRPADPNRFWLRATHGLSVFLAKTEKTEMVRHRASSWTPTARQHYLQALRRVQDRVTTLIGEIEQVAPENTSEDSPEEPEPVRSAQEPERPERPDDATDAMESHALPRAEAPRDTQDFEARRNECIDRIKTWRASGVSWSEAARQLQAEGMPTPKGVKSWNHGTLIRLAQKMGIERGDEGGS